jgi:PadR family transcriptional regulator PadR
MAIQYDREFLTGTVTVLILNLLAEREHYGYEILQEATRRSDGAFELKEGTLYPALHQLARSGLLASTWREGPGGRARKYYRLTAKGRRVARAKTDQWTSLSRVMHAIIGRGHA